MSESPRLPEFPENLESQEDSELVDNKNDDIDRFNSDDINFFDSFYKSKFVNITSAIKYSNKNTFFQDIYIFVNRVKNIVYTKKDILLR